MCRVNLLSNVMHFHHRYIIWYLHMNFLLVLSEYEHLWFTGIPYSFCYSNIASWDAFRFNFQVQVYIQSCFLEGLRPFVDSSIRLFCAR